MTRWNTALAATLVCSALVFADKKDDEVRMRVKEFQEAFNKHDAKALAAFWTKQGDLISPTGEVATGPMEIERLIASQMKDAIQGAKSVFTVKRIHFVTPEVCVVNMVHEFSGGQTPEGQPMPKGRVLITAVASKAGSTWMWEAGRPMVPYVAPAAPTQTSMPEDKEK